jgi:hypothetical protein
VAHPRKYDDSNEVIERLRQICLGFPEVVEKEAWGECTFRVAGGKMFAMTDNNHHNSGHLAVWVMAPPTVQETLIRAAPKRYFNPPYVGTKGWVGVRLDANVDWDEVAGILRDGYLLSTPVKLPRRKAASIAKSAINHQQRISDTQLGTASARAATRRRPKPRN